MRIALEHARLNNLDMAELLDVSPNTVSNYLAGRTTPSMAVLRVWAMRTGVPLDWIRYGAGPSGPPSDQPPVTDDSQVKYFRRARENHLIAA